MEKRTKNVNNKFPHAKPLLLLRKPDENGYPHLDRQSLSDFAAVQSGSDTQSITEVVATACSGPQCYKVGIHNRAFAGDILKYQVRIYLYTSTQSVFAIGNCLNSPLMKFLGSGLWVLSSGFWVQGCYLHTGL